MVLNAMAAWAFKNRPQKISTELEKLYAMSPQQYAFTQSEAAQIRAEQREREYNSPMAQMKRFAEAGLNPHLIYQQGSPGNVSSSAPKMDSPPGVLQTMLQGIQLGAQIANVSSQTSLRASQEGVNLLNQDKISAEVALAKQKLDYLSQVNPSLAGILKARNVIGDIEASVADEFLSKRATQEQDIRYNTLLEMFKRQDLLDADLKIKQSVLEGKSFTNDLLQIERDWLKNADFTAGQFWQQALQFIKLISLKK